MERRGQRFSRVNREAITLKFGASIFPDQDKFAYE